MIEDFRTRMLITQIIQVRRTRHAGEVRTNL